MHWINFPLLLVMVWSGLRIYWANDVYGAGVGGWEWFAFFPDGFYAALGLERRLARGIAFHLNFGWFFALNGLVYVAYLARSGQWRHLVPDRLDLRDAAAVVRHDLGLGGVAPEHGRYNAAQKIAYTTVIGLSILIVVSGFAIYKPTQLSPLTSLLGGYESARRIHFFTTLGITSFFLVHLVQVIRAGGANFMSMVTGFEYSVRADTSADTPEAEPAPEEEVSA